MLEAVEAELGLRRWIDYTGTREQIHTHPEMPAWVRANAYLHRSLSAK